jgi:hypothetical protein
MTTAMSLPSRMTAEEAVTLRILKTRRDAEADAEAKAKAELRQGDEHYHAERKTQYQTVIDLIGSR